MPAAPAARPPLDHLRFEPPRPAEGAAPNAGFVTDVRRRRRAATRYCALLAVTGALVEAATPDDIARVVGAHAAEPFVQVRGGYTRSHEGTGLDLAIARDLARGMGGDLRVRSRKGKGSTFTVTLRSAE